MPPSFTTEQLVEAAHSEPVQRWLRCDRSAQIARGARYKGILTRKAESIWQTLTDVQRAAALRMWRDAS